VRVQGSEFRPSLALFAIQASREHELSLSVTSRGRGGFEGTYCSGGDGDQCGGIKPQFRPVVAADQVVTLLGTPHEVLSPPAFSERRQHILNVREIGDHNRIGQGPVTGGQETLQTGSHLEPGLLLGHPISRLACCDSTQIMNSRTNDPSGPHTLDPGVNPTHRLVAGGEADNACDILCRRGPGRTVDEPLPHVEESLPGGPD
jgi:hypothetical protein